jgi:hypothetical protein
VFLDADALELRVLAQQLLAVDVRIGVVVRAELGDPAEGIEHLLGEVVLLRSITD